MPGPPTWRDIFCTASHEGSIFSWQARLGIPENILCIRSNLFPAEIKVPLNDIRGHLLDPNCYYPEIEFRS